MKHALLAASLVFALPVAAMAQDDDGDPLEAATYRRIEQVVEVMQGTTKPEAVFSERFLQAVPPDRLAAFTKQMTDANGAIKGTEDIVYKGKGAASFDLVFEQAHGDALLQVSPDDPYLVEGYRITGFHKTGDTLEQVASDVEALPGKASLGVYALEPGGPRAIMAKNGDAELAIGSTLKLYVLSALAREIAAGKRHWNDVVPLDAHSLPSGQMQGWSIGSPVTLHTLATMMISISDNTATDVLIRLLGRKAIETEMVASGHSDPGRNTPFITTVESFALKTGDPARIAEFKAADDEGQRKLLEQWAPTLDAAHVDPAKFTGTPNAIDSIEWFASPEDIARIFTRLRDSGDLQVLDILAINSGVASGIEKKWAYVGFKGGSEPGVINSSWLFKDANGKWFAVSGSWNDTDKPVDDTKFIALAMRAIALISPSGS